MTGGAKADGPVDDVSFAAAAEDEEPSADVRVDVPRRLPVAGELVARGRMKVPGDEATASDEKPRVEVRLDARRHMPSNDSLRPGAVGDEWYGAGYVLRMRVQGSREWTRFTAEHYASVPEALAAVAAERSVPRDALVHDLTRRLRDG